MRHTLAFLLFMSATPLLAQEDYSKLCKDWRKAAHTQTEMIICASEEAKAVEAELKQKYDRLISAMIVKEKTYFYPTIKGVVGKIRAAQAAWLAYRDAYIEATFPAENKQQEYGTMYSMRVSEIRIQMGREQIAHIQTLCESSVGQVNSTAICGTR